MTKQQTISRIVALGGRASSNTLKAELERQLDTMQAIAALTQDVEQGEEEPREFVPHTVCDAPVETPETGYLCEGILYEDRYLTIEKEAVTYRDPFSIDCDAFIHYDCVEEDPFAGLEAPVPAEPDYTAVTQFVTDEEEAIVPTKTKEENTMTELKVQFETRQKEHRQFVGKYSPGTPISSGQEKFMATMNRNYDFSTQSLATPTDANSMSKVLWVMEVMIAQGKVSKKDDKVILEALKSPAPVSVRTNSELISSSQVQYIKDLSVKLGKVVIIPKTKAEASKVIQRLRGEADKASFKQVAVTSDTHCDAFDIVCINNHNCSGCKLMAEYAAKDHSKPAQRPAFVAPIVALDYNPTIAYYCKECAKPVREGDKIDGYSDMYECSACGHPDKFVAPKKSWLRRLFGF